MLGVGRLLGAGDHEGVLVDLDDAQPINPAWKGDFQKATQPLIASLDDRFQRTELARSGR